MGRWRDEHHDGTRHGRDTGQVGLTGGVRKFGELLGEHGGHLEPEWRLRPRQDNAKFGQYLTDARLEELGLVLRRVLSLCPPRVERERKVVSRFVV